MGCTVTASILSQKDWVDSSKFLENNSSKDKIHTILPPSLHPKKKGHHLTTMKLWNIDAGPRTFSSKRQLATGRIPHSVGSLVWVPPPPLDAADSEGQSLSDMWLGEMKSYWLVPCAFKQDSTNASGTSWETPSSEVFENRDASHFPIFSYCQNPLLQNVMR